MDPNVRIEKISLINFRNHKGIDFSNLKPFIVLIGNNGSGKTNILEAVSLFSPGKGLKSSNLKEIPNTKEKKEYFEIKINLKYESGDLEIKRFYSALDNKKNFITVDNENISNAELLDFVNILWITPVMEKIFLQSNSEKRNFFDRLLFNLDKKHLSFSTKLIKLLKERLLILKSNQTDKGWLNIIEKNIAEISINILNNRNNFIAQLNTELAKMSLPFMSCVINFRHHEFDTVYNEDRDTLLEKYKNELFQNRKLDLDIGKTTKTVNMVNINIFTGSDSSIEAKNCSTGEQKSMLLAIFISVANMVKRKNNGRSPIMLLDEAMAHLDSDHKNQLFNELALLNSQVWFSGVSRDQFDNINSQTDFIEIKSDI